MVFQPRQKFPYYLGLMIDNNLLWQLITLNTLLAKLVKILIYWLK